MRTRRLKISGASAIYHVMTHTVAGTPHFDERAKEVLRKMIWQLADFSGVEVLTYCIMSNHFHVLVRVPVPEAVSDVELLRRYKVLYPKPTKYQTASITVMAQQLAGGGEEAEAIRQKLLARMADVSEYMKAVKQRFSVWYNRSHRRRGTLWTERFKSVLVEGKGNPLQTMAAYIDLNPVRAGIVHDSKDYRFCGYAEAVAGGALARRGLRCIWRAYVGGDARSRPSVDEALQMHRELTFGQRASDPGLSEAARRRALKVLEDDNAVLPKATVLRCRVRYFTDGAILGSQEYVRGFVDIWQMQKGRKHPPKANLLRGADWQDLACIQGLRQSVFG
ncbi:MAG: transposase [Puniceicoccaceae bacterium]|nr:transposase [Puniceicoccaceae bacterium]